MNKKRACESHTRCLVGPILCLIGLSSTANQPFILKFPRTHLADISTRSSHLIKTWYPDHNRPANIHLQVDFHTNNCGHTPSLNAKKSWNCQTSLLNWLEILPAHHQRAAFFSSLPASMRPGHALSQRTISPQYMMRKCVFALPHHQAKGCRSTPH